MTAWPGPTNALELAVGQSGIVKAFEKCKDGCFSTSTYTRIVLQEVAEQSSKYCSFAILQMEAHWIPDQAAKIFEVAA